MPVLLGSGVILAWMAPAQASTPNMNTQTKTLWTIGRPDGSMADLALDAADFVKYPTRFPVGPTYVVGRSDPSQDWPHVHPGPLDTWAGGRPHTFTITFGLREKPNANGGRLLVYVLDANLPEPPRLRITINGFAQEHALPGGSHYMLEERAPAGAPHTVTTPVPADALQAGENVVTITTTTGCWLVYDAIVFEGPADAALAPTRSETSILQVRPLAAVLRGEQEAGGEAQWIELVNHHSGETTEAVVEAGDATRTPITLRTGSHTVCARAPVVQQETHIPIRLSIGGKIVAEHEATIRPVRPWKVYVLHHTHLDIGYTHVQSEVLDRQIQHLRRATELARQTAGYSTEARFRWNPEGLWAVEAFLNRADDEQRDALLAAVRAGSIGLDALYANHLTALCRPEELFEVLHCARRLRTDYDLTIDSAMISDIPGYTWGLIPVLAQSGIRYLSLGPNRAHRIGRTLAAWGDRPFYWRSPCGQHRVLCWMAGQGYAWFHGTARTTEDFGGRTLRSAFDGRRLLAYLSQLEQDHYPYDFVQLRYNIDTDNGPPDSCLPDLVRAWNEKYVSPQLVLTTTHEMFEDFEQRYGDSIPTVRGDFTPYWEDGAASSARETAWNRAAAERLVQAETLWALLHPTAFPISAFDSAWRNVVLFDEHTWGSWNSISEPKSPFTEQQWETKRQFAMEARNQSRGLLNTAAVHLARAQETADRFAVFNTSSWPRSEVLILPADAGRPGDRVTDQGGKPVPSQRLRTGELAVLVGEVPALAAAVYNLSAGQTHSGDEVRVSGTTLSNGLLTVDVDPITGVIGNLRHRDIDSNLVDRSKEAGLGAYLYVAGRDPKQPQREEPLSVEVIERGPLVASVKVESQAPGCKHLTREVRLMAGADHVDLITTLDKEAVYDPEAVYLAFPFAIPEPQVRVDVAWGIMRPEADQLPGACRNYFTAQRWVDVSNDRHGITLATIDAPLIEIGELATDATVVGWREQAKEAGLLYAYVMNNYWETNYLAAQPGRATIRYAIRPHGPFGAAKAKRFGVERSQPLTAVPLGEGHAVSSEPLVVVEPAEVMVTRLKPLEEGRALLVRLFNASEQTRAASLTSSGPDSYRTWHSSPDGTREAAVTMPIEIPAWGIVTLRLEHNAGPG
jgi:hypothetical protein